MKRPIVHLHRRLLGAVATLGAGVTLFRPGTSAPAAGGLAAVPAFGTSRARRPNPLRRALRFATLEGMVAEVVAACFGGAVLTGWALHLDCPPPLLGLIVALPSLAQIAQAPAAFITRRFDARVVCQWALGAARQTIWPLVLLPFVDLADSTARALLLVVVAVQSLLAVLGNNAWISWMGDLVPRRILGRYFGRRTALATFAGAMAAGIAGVLLDRLTAERALIALSALGAISGLAGAVASLLLQAQRRAGRASALTEAVPPPTRKGFWGHVIAPYRDPRARPALRYLLVWNLAVGIAASFFGVHMLKNLHMGFVLMAVHGAGIAVVRLFAAPLLGRALDRFGIRPMLIVCSAVISIFPALWLLPRPDFLWPLLLDAFLSGIFWGGHALATFALPLQIAPPWERPTYVAAFSTVAGVALVSASVLGGLVAVATPASFSVGGVEFVNLHVVLALSAVARGAATFFALSIHEPRSASAGHLLRHLMGEALSAVRTPRPSIN